MEPAGDQAGRAQAQGLAPCCCPGHLSRAGDCSPSTRQGVSLRNLEFIAYGCDEQADAFIDLIDQKFQLLAQQRGLGQLRA
jgi:hypothetical protein